MPSPTRSPSSLPMNIHNYKGHDRKESWSPQPLLNCDTQVQHALDSLSQDAIVTRTRSGCTNEWLYLLPEWDTNKLMPLLGHTVDNMAPKYKLTYFDFEARAEPIRFMLSFAGKEFEDVRIPWDQWPKLKSDMPFGKIPVLEVNGKKMDQTASICRYLAKQCELTGSNDLENYEIDAVVDTIQDLAEAILNTYNIHDEEAKKKKLESLKNETLPFYTSKLDSLVKNNKGHFVNGKLTWADIFFAAWMDTFSFTMKYDIIADCTNLKSLKQKVFDLPAIKVWVAKRPKMPA